jgi:UDP-GlcNAc:undecaprenyl-phosphate/decaprenyl-phosphate GlcNAc-1-phosphate transferase
MNIWQSSLAAGLIALAVSLLLTPLIVRLAHRFRWYDLPDQRKIHTNLVPRLGGVGMFVSFLVATLVVSVVLRLRSHGVEASILSLTYLPILVGFFLIHGTGLADDLRALPAPLKLLLQVVAAAVITGGGFIIKSMSLPYVGKISLGLWAYPLTVLWIIGIANAINLIDGMDGLAGGISAFAAVTMGVVALIQGRFEAALFSFAIAGAVVGFLRYNLPPARIFMGDSGAYFLGFVLATIPLLGISKMATVGTLILPLTLLIIPIMDTIAAIIRRIREGRHPFSPDKEHLHHKLLALGLGERHILAVIYGFSLYLSVVAITSVILPDQANTYLVLVVWAGTMLGFYSLSAARRRQPKVAATTKARAKRTVRRTTTRR